MLRIVPYSALHFSAYESYRQSLARMFARHAGVAEEAYHVVPAVDLLARPRRPASRPQWLRPAAGPVAGQGVLQLARCAGVRQQSRAALLSCCTWAGRPDV